MSRKKFSESMVIATLWNCGIMVPCYRCKIALLPTDKIEREHVTEISLGGADDPTNCVYSHKACHAVVTNGRKHLRMGSSKHLKAKVDRILGLTCTGPSKKIQGRPFQQGKRKMQSAKGRKIGVWGKGNVRDVNDL
jgi:hypothetical protein